MPRTYETLNLASDLTTTRTLLHEAIPITGNIVSGTYGTYEAERNIKNYAHGQFQSVYDYPYLSSSANHIFDITMGYDETSVLSGATSVQNAKKINMYNQFSQVLLGYTGSSNVVEIFESDLNFSDNNRQMKEVFFINFSRLLTKDQIKKGSFSISLATGSWASGTPGAINATSCSITLADVSASETGGTNNKGNAGEYGVLYKSSAPASGSYGLVFYQAGIAIVSASIFDNSNNPNQDFNKEDDVKKSLTASFTGSSISGNCDALRHRLQNISFNNSTEINSTIYFCRVPHNKFNYSTNPTYTSASQIRVKAKASDTPVSYLTTIGLYNAENELLATAKLSEPLKKDPTTELTLRVRLDY